MHENIYRGLKFKVKIQVFDKYINDYNNLFEIKNLEEKLMNEQIEVLSTANEYMENLKSGINKLVDYIQGGEEQSGIELIPDIADGIGWIIDVVNLTRESQKENIDISMIDEKLSEVVEAIENEDYILVGDLFNYEILPILESVHEGIKTSLIVLN